MNVYEISLFLFGGITLAHHLPALQIIEGDFQAQGIDGLIGRDGLSVAHMSYAGPSIGLCFLFDVSWIALAARDRRRAEQMRRA